jgi:integrase
VDGYRVALAHAGKRIGATPIDEITVDDIARLVAELQVEGYAGNTIAGVLKPVRQIMARAMRLGMIRANPVRLLEPQERPVIRRGEMRILEREEIAALLDHATPAYRAALATAIFTGLRCGELLALQHQHVDLDRHIIQVRQQIDRDRNLQPLKTQHARRDVLLTASLTELLRAHRLQSRDQRPDAFVFSSRRGRPIHPETLRQYGLNRAAAAAGLNLPGQPRLRLHDLRHSYASLAIAQGMSVAFVSRSLGHARISMTLDVYTHAFDHAQHAAQFVERLEHEFRDVLSSGSGRRIDSA